MKKVISALTIMVLLLTCCVSCNSDVDEKMFGKKPVVVDHQHYYKLLSDGSWQCTIDPCTYVLEGTESPYITVVVDGQPTEIIPLTGNIVKAVGAGNIVVNGSVITYTNNSGTAQNVVIRTNGGELKLDAPSDKVKFYGNAQVIDVDHISSTSLWMYGSANMVNMSNGRLVITNAPEAAVGTIFLSATEENYNNIILATQNGAELPEIIARQEVALPDSGEKKIIATVQDVDKEGIVKGQEEHIYLYGAQTSYEEVKGYENVSNMGTLILEAPVGTSGGFFTIKVKDGEGTKDVEVKYDELPAEVKEDKTGNAEEIKTTVTAFSIGNGTETNPFMIQNAEEFRNISKITKPEKVWYKLANSIVVDQTEKSSVDVANADIDFNGKTLTVNSTFDGQEAGIFKLMNEIYLHNGTIEINGALSVVYDYKGCGDTDLSNTKMAFKDLILKGNVATANGHYGVLCSYAGNWFNFSTQCTTVVVENLTSYVNIKSSSTIIGGLFGYCAQTYMTLKNIKVYSNIETGGTAGGILMGDPQVCGNATTNKVGTGKTEDDIQIFGWSEVTDCYFYGSILVPEKGTAYYFGSTTSKTGKADAEYAGTGASLVKGINIDEDIISDNNEIQINGKKDYTKYEIRYSFNVDNVVTKSGGYPSTIVKQFENNADCTINTGIYKFMLREGSYTTGDTYVDSINETKIFTRNGDNGFYYYNTDGTYKISDGNVYITVYAYIGDNLKAIGSFSYSAK